MKKKLFVVFVLLVVALVLFSVGCSDSGSTYLSIAHETNLYSEVVCEGGIGHEMHYRNVSRLMSVINSGDYNISSVDTYYDSWGYMTRAVIIYNHTTFGEGNNLRLQVITAEYYYAERRLDNFLGWGYRIFDIRRIDQGQKEVIEIYYFRR